MAIFNSNNNLCSDPEAKLVRKRKSCVKVVFAGLPGKLQTLEGEVAYQAGAAILTGESGDMWPVERHKFEVTYVPMNITQLGEDGAYCKKPIEAYALQLSESSSVAVGYSDDLVTGKIGDWLVQYGTEDFGIVSAAIFNKTYEIIK